jgi:hypothetical protein
MPEPPHTLLPVMEWRMPQLRSWLASNGFTLEEQMNLLTEFPGQRIPPQNIRSGVIQIITACGFSPERAESCVLDLEKYMNLPVRVNYFVEACKRAGFNGLELIKNFTVSVCFLIDCTGSMGTWIDLVKNKIREIRQRLIEELPFTPKFAIVGYRDVNDTEMTRVLDFTESESGIEQFVEFLNNTHAIGGGDLPEHVAAGLQKVTQLQWESDRRILYHLTDAPCHGSKYHNLDRKYDQYYDGIPSHLNPQRLDVEELVKQLGTMKIKYLFCKITDHTNRMIDIFSQVYRETPGNQFNLVIKHIDHTTNQLVDDVVKESLGICAGVQTSEVSIGNPVVPNWNLIEKTSVNLYVGGNCRPVHVKIAPHHFSEGATRWSFYGILYDGNKEYRVVLKKWKGVPTEISETRCLNQQNCHQLAEQIFGMAESLSQYLVKFRSCSEALGITIPNDQEFVNLIKQIKPFNILHMDYVKFTGSTRTGQFFTIEHLLEGEFVKYSNNATYFRPLNDPIHGETSRRAQMFSHLSYFVCRITRNDRMMVVDLQGVGDDLTDLAVHSTSLMHYGNTNLGTPGIIEFFRVHRELNLPCCRLLGTVDDL